MAGDGPDVLSFGAAEGGRRAKAKRLARPAPTAAGGGIHSFACTGDGPNGDRGQEEEKDGDQRPWTVGD